MAMSQEEFDALVAKAVDARLGDRRSEGASVLVGAAKSRTVRFSVILGAIMAYAPELAWLWAQHIAPLLPPEASRQIMAIVGFVTGAYGVYLRLTTAESLEAKGRQ